jgi:hypothetical protein
MDADRDRGFLSALANLAAWATQDGRGYERAGCLPSDLGNPPTGARQRGYIAGSCSLSDGAEGVRHGRVTGHVR